MSHGDDGTSQIADATVEEAKTQARALEQQGRAQVQQLAEDGKRELNRAARSALDTAADRLESFASDLRHQDPASLLSRGERLARENPALFFAGAAVAGIALTRFIKASGEARRQQDRDNQALETAPRQATAPVIPSQQYDAPPALPARPLEVPVAATAQPAPTTEFAATTPTSPTSTDRTWETD